MSSASEDESLHGKDNHEETEAAPIAVLRPSQVVDATEPEGAAASVASEANAASFSPSSPKGSDKPDKVPPAKATRPAKSRRKQKASNMPSRPLSGETN
jgi:hypothetical protein